MRETTIEHASEQVNVCPPGDIVASTCQELRPKLKDLVSQGFKKIVLDLTHTNMVDSSGIGLLVATHNSLRSGGGALEVIHASADVLALFQAMRIHKHFNVSGD